MSDVLALGWPAYLNAGWYWDWGARGTTELPPLQYVQTIQLKPVLSNSVQIGYTVSPTGTTLLSLIAEQPGATWFIGNEPDCSTMNNMRSEWYARAYHDVYVFIKTADPTAKIAAGNIVQPTLQRFMYLDRVLTEYQTRYGEPLPADLWSVHSFILCENCYPIPAPGEPFAWGACWVPDWPSSSASAPYATFYSVYDHWDVNIFTERIETFRQWMYDNGYRNHPLVIPEYGVLFYEGLIYSGSTYDAKNREFMYGGFDWMQEGRDSLTGYRPDDSRLVQGWAWYSLDHGSYPGGTLFDPDTYQPTVLGDDYAAYTALVTPTVDLKIFDLVAIKQLVPDGSPITATVELTVANAGNIVTNSDITVTVYQSATTHIPIGEVVTPPLDCCGDHHHVSMLWPNLTDGLYQFCTTASTAYTETNPVCSYLWVAELSAFNDGPTPCGATTTLSATVSDGSDVTYTWAFGDGTFFQPENWPGSGKVVTHTYPTVGTYTAIVTAANQFSELTATTWVTITETPVVGLAAFNDSPTPLGDATTLTATVAAGSGVSYTWAFGDGTLDSGKVVQHIYSDAGFYTATVTATNSLNSLTATTHVTITAVTPVTGLLAFNDSPTPLGNVTMLSATVESGNGVTYTWDFGDGALGNGAVIQHIYPDTGFYTATVTATNSVNSLTATTHVTITASTPVTGLLAFNDSPTPLGGVTTLSATVESGSGMTYTWAFGDGAFFFPQNWPDDGKVVTHTYSAVGTYTATVTATNRGGQSTMTTTVVVEDAPIAGLRAHNNGPTLLEETTMLSATVTVGSNISFTWDLGDGQSAVGVTVAHVYAEARIYTATVTATNPINTVSAFTVVTIMATPRIYLPLVMRQ
ncbi:MAG: PKD domain-containing protein [Anaerolineae bacterium]|nr:PKD domain-containing protein [Anaerolineae bacterium]